MKYLSVCPICKSVKIIRYGKKILKKRYKPKNIIDTEDQFLLERLEKTTIIRSIFLCRSCFFLFQNPTYDHVELNNLYNNERPGILKHYKAVGVTAEDLWDSELSKKNLAERQKRYAHEIIARRGRKVLDYGGGAGINLTHPSLNQD